MSAEWMDQAVCAKWGADPVEFDNAWDNPAARETIRVYCNLCPVATQCLEAVPDDFTGIMGGVLFPANRRMPRYIGGCDDPYLLLCGTPAGYQRHRRRKEPACPVCVTAHTIRHEELTRKAQRRAAAEAAGGDAA